MSFFGSSLQLLQRFQPRPAAPTKHRDRDQDSEAPPASEKASGADVVSQMLTQGRYAFLLRPQIARTLAEGYLQSADRVLQQELAFIAGGLVRVAGRNWRAEPLTDDDGAADHLVHVEPFYMDRRLVSNEQFAQFVLCGGYRQPSFWEPAIRPSLGEFRDLTGQPGPRFWRSGKFPEGRGRHPVVGICWYEASAYACWVGKRLPTDAEWVRAAAVPVSASEDRLVQRKFPWGENFDQALANLWETGIGDTSPVDQFAAGQSPAGICQLIGNVWEWTATEFGIWDVGERPEADTPLKALRGGAFDTYFPQQACWQFQSGDHLLARRRNVGFRCALGACDVFQPSQQAQEQDL